MSSPKILKQNSRPPDTKNIDLETAIYQQLDLLSNQSSRTFIPHPINNTHKNIRNKLENLLPGFLNIERDSTDHNNDKSLIILMKNQNIDLVNDCNGINVRLKRSQAEIELHVMLQSHYRMLNPNSPDLGDSVLVSIDDNRNKNKFANQNLDTARSATTKDENYIGEKTKSKIMLTSSITLPHIVDQSGHICKPAALANIDRYYSGVYGKDHIPLRKNERVNSVRAGENSTNSIRKIAKTYRSTQGEVLDHNDYQAMAKEMGYSTETVSPKNVDEFIELVSKHILVKSPLVTCFAVDSKTGGPTDDYTDNEHACVITGIDTAKQTLEIAHWGKLFQGISISRMFSSMCALPETRDQEIYSTSNKGITADKIRKTYKYEKRDGQTKNHTTDKKSIIPNFNTGFRNRIFIFEPFLAAKRWLKE